MLSGFDFVSLDVETANYSRGSVCSIGYAVVRDGARVEQGQWLCRPPEEVGHFEGFNVRLHGITPAMVASQPRFEDRLGDLLDRVADLPVVAHNASFDVGAIRTACYLSDIEWPTFDYGCSLMWSRRLLNLINYSLPFVAGHLDVKLDAHHDAEADAVAAADVTLALAALHDVATIDELCSKALTRLGRLTAVDWRGCRTICDGGGGSPKAAPAEANQDADPHHPLFGQVMAFTGALASMKRQEAFDLVARLGAVGSKSVTKNTTLLVIGDGFAGTTPDEFWTGKALDACRWRAKGKPIQVLTEPEFLSYAAETESSGTRA
ncbi:hypothetical protein H5P33_02465 [Mycolicibacterium arabiense]|uniref:exonuclease domain-containing protein n=1 Tax=Mycolicibacterium arabiense TaxID=1286181 RepID=UPI0013D86452|nr:exonuclease domain-containing protein [Mycolicibacterium arabiense]MCV7371578.1 hypothetical protein [Mycolicibacterium arabiense]